MWFAVQVFPAIADIRTVSHAIAVAVCEVAERDGLATEFPPDHSDW